MPSKARETNDVPKRTSLRLEANRVEIEAASKRNEKQCRLQAAVLAADQEMQDVEDTNDATEDPMELEKGNTADTTAGSTAAQEPSPLPPPFQQGTA